jgi:hypothetical protein
MTGGSRDFVKGKGQLWILHPTRLKRSQQWRVTQRNPGKCMEEGRVVKGDHKWQS